MVDKIKNDEDLETYILNFLKTETKERDVTLYIGEGANVTTSNLECSGYFTDNPTPTLAVAVGKDKTLWIPIAIHESCHMDQWYEKSDLWAFDNLSVVDKWLTGAEFEYNEIKSNILGSLKLELDCEKRSVEKFINLGLDKYINIEEYIKKSNAYVLFYLAMLRTRKWYSVDKRPYEMKECFECMPAHWDLDYENENDKLVDIIIKICL